MLKPDFAPEKLEAFLAAEFGPGQLDLTRIGGGQSNPTYIVGWAGKRMVLRKQPNGTLLPGAHAIGGPLQASSSNHGTICLGYTSGTCRVL